MHELSLMDNLLNAAKEQLAPYSVKKVTAVRVKAGVLANILPEAFQFAFETLSQGTYFAGAELQYEEVPFQAECLQCGTVFYAKNVQSVCPQCGCENYTILSGFDVFLTGIDFEE